jgi:hypothetical protein
MKQAIGTLTTEEAFKDWSGNFCRDVKAACLNFEQPQEESKESSLESKLSDKVREFYKMTADIENEITKQLEQNKTCL